MVFGVFNNAISDELRNYIDERIEAIMNEIQNAFRGEENNNDLASANRSIIDYKVFKKMVQSDAFHLDVDVKMIFYYQLD